jgi:hypothetical protein
LLTLWSPTSKSFRSFQAISDLTAQTRLEPGFA